MTSTLLTQSAHRHTRTNYPRWPLWSQLDDLDRHWLRRYAGRGRPRIHPSGRRAYLCLWWQRSAGRNNCVVKAGDHETRDDEDLCWRCVAHDRFLADNPRVVAFAERWAEHNLIELARRVR